VANDVNARDGKRLSLSDDEIAIIELYRALQLDRSEAMSRLSTPSVAPIPPLNQELQSNLAAVARDLLPPDPTADHPTQR
jgi:hypothetical protein